METLLIVHIWGLFVDCLTTAMPYMIISTEIRLVSMINWNWSRIKNRPFHPIPLIYKSRDRALTKNFGRSSPNQHTHSNVSISNAELCICTVLKAIPERLYSLSLNLSLSDSFKDHSRKQNRFNYIFCHSLPPVPFVLIGLLSLSATPYSALQVLVDIYNLLFRSDQSLKLVRFSYLS